MCECRFHLCRLLGRSPARSWDGRPNSPFLAEVRAQQWRKAVLDLAEDPRMHERALTHTHTDTHTKTKSLSDGVGWGLTAKTKNLSDGVGWGLTAPNSL
eukprot:86674-Amphidinium_carterae.1